MKNFKTNNLKLINLNIESNKSARPKSISIKILRLQNNDISKHLLKIYNILFTAGIFPDKLKVAKVILVLEKDSQLEFFNYRPTSFWSDYNSLIKVLTEQKVLSLRQVGSRKKILTTHVIIILLDSIENAINQRKFG